jgi:hypothetical protein
MNKQEILDAINATIAPNGVKGITAESLANILTEIVNAMGEGGGAGGEYIDVTLLEPDNPESIELTAEAKEHNAELYAKVLDAINNVKALPSVAMQGASLGVPGAYYASSALIASDKLSFSFHMGFIFPADPSVGSNYIDRMLNMATREEEEIAIGGDLMQVIVNILADGSIEFIIPGFM